MKFPFTLQDGVSLLLELSVLVRFIKFLEKFKSIHAIKPPFFENWLGYAVFHRHAPCIKILWTKQFCCHLMCSAYNLIYHRIQQLSQFQPAEREVFNEILDELPEEKNEVLRSFMTYIRDSDSWDCASLLDFFKTHKDNRRFYERVSAKNSPKSATGIAGNVVLTISAYKAKNWLYAYIMTSGTWTYFETFYKEVAQRLIVADEENWQQRILRIKREAEAEYGEYGWPESRKKVLYSLSREIQRDRKSVV